MICRLLENLQHVIKNLYHPVIIGDLDQDLGSHIELGSRAFFVPSQCLDKIWDTFFVLIDNRDRIKIAKSQLSPVSLLLNPLMRKIGVQENGEYIIEL